MADAGGGLVVKVHGGQLDVAQNAGDDAAHSSDADLVAALQNSCWPSRTAMKNQTRIQHIKTNHNILQGTATSRCCSVAKRRQSPLHPRRQLGCLPAKLMLALTHRNEKANANSGHKTNHKIRLTRPSDCTLLFCCRAAAIAFAPSSPTWLPYCKTHVGPHARR